MCINIVHQNTKCSLKLYLAWAFTSSSQLVRKPVTTASSSKIKSPLKKKRPNTKWPSITCSIHDTNKYFFFATYFPFLIRLQIAYNLNQHFVPSRPLDVESRFRTFPYGAFTSVIESAWISYQCHLYSSVDVVPYCCWPHNGWNNEIINETSQRCASGIRCRLQHRPILFPCSELFCSHVSNWYLYLFIQHWRYGVKPRFPLLEFLLLHVN